MKRVAVIVFLAVSLCSCKCKADLGFDIFRDFPAAIDLTDYDIVTSELLYPSGVVLLDSLIFVGESQYDPMIVCLDLATQTSISFLHKGRGPGETTNLLSIRAYGDSAIQASVDPETLFVYDAKNINDNAMPVELITLKDGLTAFSTIAKVGSGNLIFCGKDPKNAESNYTRFCLYDMSADSVHCFGEYPAEDDNIADIPVEDFSRLLAYQGNFTVRPDNGKAVVNYFYAVGFEIIDIKTRTVAKSKFYQYPKVLSTHIPELKTNIIKRVPESYRGFIDSFCSRDYIYFLYSGKTFDDADYNSARHILKYDWDGNPVCHYTLSEEVDFFTLDKEEKNIYATKTDENTGYLIKYKI